MLKKIYKAPIYGLRLIHSHGIKTALARIAGEIYSNTDYIILSHNLQTISNINYDRRDLRIDQLKLNDLDGIEQVCEVWPKKWRSKHLRTKIISDLEKGDLCFLLRSNGKINGAAWLGSKDEIIRHCPGADYQNEGVIKSLFVIPQSRGKGFSKILINHIVKTAKERQSPHVFVYIRPGRKASLKAHLSVGFDELGVLKVRSCLGKTKYEFIHNVKPCDRKKSSFEQVSVI